MSRSERGVWRRWALAGLLAVVAVCAPRAASADTTISGGNVVNQTWTPAGSPYIVQGDITVPAGAYLNINAGVEVRFANGDMQAAGLDPSRTELTVNGTLDVSGTAGSPVVFKAQSSTSPGVWYGIVVGAGATEASINHAVIEHATIGVRSASTAGLPVIADTIVRTTSSNGIYLLAGAADLDRVTITGTGSSSLYVTGSARAAVDDSLIVDNSGQYGVYVTSTDSTGTTLTNCTLDNNYFGVYTSGASARLYVTNSIITGSYYGAYRSSGTLQLSYSDVWGNWNNNYNATYSTGVISANPLYVSSGNRRLTSNSPARFAGGTGGDLGALPYVADATAGLHGVLWTDTTLSAAGSPYDVGGDLTVADGVTLTIAAGTTVRFGNGDLMGSGLDTALTSLLVKGTLVAVGTSGSPIVLEAKSGSAGGWYGLRFEAGSSESLVENVAVHEAVIGVRYDANEELSLSRVDVYDTSSNGVYTTTGVLNLDASRIEGTGSSSVYVTGSGRVALTNALIVDNPGQYGVYVTSTNATGTTVTNCTLANNYFGVYTSGASSKLYVVNSIITGNNYGVYRSSGTLQLSYSDVWGNSTNNYNGSYGTGVISENPQYVGGGDYHLQSTSVCLDAGTASGAPTRDFDGVPRPLDGDGIGAAVHDLGAYELALGSYCGDDTIDAGEVCDDGVDNGKYGFCKADCSGDGPYCGDGVTDGPVEQCDDANTNNTDACVAGCVSATCGDGYIQVGVEDCDDGNDIDDDGCSNSCEGPICGNGVVEPGEACDDGNASNTDGCVAGCEPATCGDGYVRAGVEACDDGNDSESDGCMNDCSLPSCGDGVTQGGEACDDGNSSNTDGCLNTCLLASCGDTHVQAGVEECDDGNGDSTDDCLASCELAVCGDGYIRAGAEECDDGNAVDTDACTTSCTAATCGDGIVQTGVEGCDDGNTDDGDGCSAVCLLPSCGDGEVQPEEQCDDGNEDDRDACLSTCAANTCGDGYLNLGVEQCDDANTVAGDGCSASCTFEQPDPDPGEDDGGGCGCSASSDASGSALWLLLAAVFVLRRRRSRYGLR